MADEVEAEVERARRWLVEQALPLWSGSGFDRGAGLFAEALGFDGRAIGERPTRLMVQCRQIYVFAQAETAGWFAGRPVVGPALQGLLRLFRTRGRSDWAFAVDRRGRVADARGDSYSYAFLLYALAWAHRLTGETRWRVLAEDAVAALDRGARAQDGRGYRDALGGPAAPLRQNPQMHLLEAFLEWHAVTGDPSFLARAEAIVALFHERLFDPVRRALPELFDADWRVLDAEGQRWEPGHHCEWAWLLLRFAAASGRDLRPSAALLLERATGEGADGGLLVDERPLRAGLGRTSLRVWPQCEGVKAHAACVRAGLGDPVEHRRAAAGLLAGLRRRFLDPAPAGGWIDRIDAEGRPASADMPASTLYHLALAIAEAERAFAPGRP